MKLFIDAENQILKWSANRVFFTTLVKKKKYVNKVCNPFHTENIKLDMIHK